MWITGICYLLCYVIIRNTCRGKQSQKYSLVNFISAQIRRVRAEMRYAKGSIFDRVSPNNLIYLDNV